EEWQNVAALELAANDYITCRVNPVDLKNRLCDVETDCRDRLHVWLLRIVGPLTAPTCMALPCRWRSRPQHQKRTFALQQDFLIRSPRRRGRAASAASTTSGGRRRRNLALIVFPGGTAPSRPGPPRTSSC